MGSYCRCVDLEVIPYDNFYNCLPLFYSDTLFPLILFCAVLIIESEMFLILVDLLGLLQKGENKWLFISGTFMLLPRSLLFFGFEIISLLLLGITFLT